MPRRKVPMGFIGYVRVSTTAQLNLGESLHAQSVRLQEYARGLGVDIEIVPGSEAGYGPVTGRPRFIEALEKAKTRGWPVLVTKPCRFSRDVKHLKHINLRTTPVWICGEGKASRDRLLDGIKIAARELQQLRSDGASGVLKRSTGQHTEEAEINAKHGRAAGAKANGDRAFRNRLRVQNFLEQTVGASEMTRLQLVDMLNASEILNCVSERNRTYKPWTIQSLRPVRKDAMLQIQLDNEPD